MATVTEAIARRLVVCLVAGRSPMAQAAPPKRDRGRRGRDSPLQPFQRHELDRDGHRPWPSRSALWLGLPPLVRKAAGRASSANGFDDPLRARDVEFRIRRGPASGLAADPPGGRQQSPAPSTYTKGTGTYIVGEGEVAVIDPGPDLAAPPATPCWPPSRSGERVTHILTTHTHQDHSPLSDPLARQLTGATDLRPASRSPRSWARPRCVDGGRGSSNAASWPKTWT